jgi:hypothetical protein
LILVNISYNRPPTGRFSPLASRNHGQRRGAEAVWLWALGFGLWGLEWTGDRQAGRALAQKQRTKENRIELKARSGFLAPEETSGIRLSGD